MVLISNIAPRRSSSPSRTSISLLVREGLRELTAWVVFFEVITAQLKGNHMSNDRLTQLCRSGRRKPVRRSAPPVMGYENPVILTALVLARGEAAVHIGRANRSVDISLEILGKLMDLLLHTPLLTDWTPVLNEMAARAQPQNQNWAFCPGRKPVLSELAGPLKGPPLLSGHAASYLRWFVLSGPLALRSKTFCADRITIAIPRIRGEAADSFRDLAGRVILPAIVRQRTR